MSQALFDKHRETLDKATNAIKTREYFSAFPEVPSGKIYGETAKDDGLKAFRERSGHTYNLQPGGSGTVGDEKSPYGVDLNVKYPKLSVDDAVKAAKAAMPKWRDASVETRVGVCLEILKRLNARSFELAFAVMHTTGQGFMMAFQAGGPHAQDRGLEAVAYAYEAMKRVPETTSWTKQVSKTDSITLKKHYRIIPRGVAAVIGCSTFPTWNSYPAFFASLATGNAVIVKPHPGAVLPLAITVEVAQEVLKESGFEPSLVTLLADDAKDPLTKKLVEHPDVAIIDYTGGSEFGNWIEQHAGDKAVFTEKAGVNSTIIDSIDDLKAFTGNLAFSLSLYSGQMCTTPQNLFIPKDGIRVGGEKLSFDDTCAAIVKAVDWLLSDPARANEILGAIQNEKTAARIDAARNDGGKVLRESAKMSNETFPNARVHSPLLLQVDAKDEKHFMQELFGPIACVVKTDSTQQSIDLARKAAEECGAITCGVYSTDEAVLSAAEDAMAEAGVALSCNLTGPIYVNQSAAYSDYHVCGCNPAGNATLCDDAFVSNRFRVAQSRRPA
ncbi:MAG: phenylacetic acid degradation protein PaaN [Phycisphaerae bacterium]